MGAKLLYLSCPAVSLLKQWLDLLVTMEVVNIFYQISNLTVVLSSKLTVCAKKAAGIKIRKISYKYNKKWVVPPIVLSLYSSKWPFTKRITKLYNTNSVSKAISILLYKTQVLNYLDFPTADSPRSIYIFLLVIVIYSQLSLCMYIPRRTSLNWYAFPCVGVCLVDILYVCMYVCMYVCIYYIIVYYERKTRERRKEKKKKQTEIVVIAYTWY
jgi:hypothetical protein